jgi:glycosyltransferase involved in cell wall biosynthesis
MFETVAAMDNWADSIFWIYYDPHGKHKRTKDFITQNGRITEIYIHEITQEKLQTWLDFLNPSLVHHQGHFRKETVAAASALNIPLLTGYHFWNEGLKLHPAYGNSNILPNALLHTKHESFDFITENSTAYCPSLFVQECFKVICKKTVPNVISAIFPITKHKFADVVPITSRKFVTQLNLCTLKGGNLFHHLVKQIPQLPFLGFSTEGSLIPEIKAIREAPNLTIHTQYCTDIGKYLKQTRILLIPSLVDETFCRALVEGLFFGCVVVCSNYGNLPILAGNGALVMDTMDPTVWASTIANLSEKQLLHWSKKARIRYGEVCASPREFRTLCATAIRNSSRNNIGHFTVWADQGLGIQSRYYLNVLESAGFECSVFSFMPYNKRNFHKTKEWHHDRVYYSGNIREQVKDREIIQFIHKFNIGVMIIPEICFDRIFEIAALLRRHYVKVIAVPNLEICRKSEMKKYNSCFDRVIVNNRRTMEILADFNVPSTYVGFALPPSKDLVTKQQSRTLKFLVIGGKNPFARKRVHRILKAFEKLNPKFNDYHLTITLNSKKQLRTKSPNIHIINRYLTTKEICEMYETHHVYIQLSCNEGLGLNLYEALAFNMFLITFDISPYNEEIKQGYNGVLISSQLTKMKDNPQAIIKENGFSETDLIDAIESLDREYVQNYKNKDHREYFIEKHESYKNRFISAISF